MSSGKNDKNVDSRVSKGMGIVSEIMDILENISLGPYYFHVAILLRNSLLVNGMLYNTDVWYNLSSRDIKELSDVDKHFLGRILRTPNSTPHESLYLELGIDEFDVILSKRRLLYFHDVITRRKKDMLYRFILAQWHDGIRGDWTEMVKTDLCRFDIKEDLTYLQTLKKPEFRRMVMLQAKRVSLENLTRKQSTHSKLKNIKYKELKMQNYFQHKTIPLELKRIIFMFRTHMARFKLNYKFSY